MKLSWRWRPASVCSSQELLRPRNATAAAPRNPATEPAQEMGEPDFAAEEPQLYADRESKVL